MSKEKNRNLFQSVLKRNNRKDVAVQINRSIDLLSIKESEVAFEFDSRKHIKYGTKYQAAWGMFSEYCDKTTIHGIKYLGEQKRPIVERLFWISVFLLSIYTCTLFILNIWNKWTYNPVIVSFAEKSTPVWEIPFPAVTICKERKFTNKIFNYKAVLDKLTTGDRVKKTDAYYFEAISQICYRRDLAENDFGRKFANISDLVKAMENALPRNNPCYDIKWRNNGTTCNKFRSVLTDEGMCFTFNNLEPKDIYREGVFIYSDDERNKDIENYENEDQNEDMYEAENKDDNEDESKNESKDKDENIDEYDDEHLDGSGDNADYGYDNYDEDEYEYFGEEVYNETVQWDLENGYSLKAGIDAFPYRVLRDGVKAGLFLKFEDDYENHTRCEAKVPGFKILLHTPGEVPSVSDQYISIPFNQVVLISIKPEIITTSEGLKHYDPIKRHCYLQNERELRYFKVYTQSNCKLECLSNITMKHCGCVKFSMPRTINASVCGAAKIRCMRQAEGLLAQKEFKQSLQKTTEKISGATGCNCLPGCTSISYNAEISQGDIDFVGVVHQITQKIDLKDGFKYEWSEVSIFFKEAQFITSKRSELYGTTDFLANCGGLLGLFMGVSTLSIVELIYFCTVRLLTNLRMRRKKRLELERLQHEEGAATE